jgi:hypothetical protein
MSENNQDITMGNQQERPLEWELAWLAGIMDGEGSFLISVNSTHRSVYPRISITNTNIHLMDKVVELVKKLGLKYNLKLRIGRKVTYSNSLQLSIHTAKRVLLFIQTVEPYLVGKKEHASLVKEFCESRISLPYGYPYTERELELRNLLTKLQDKVGHKTKNGIPNDYTPSVRPRYIPKLHEDIV